MKTQIKYTDTWKFSELDAATQQKAISNLYDINVDYEWWEFVYNDAENVGVKITEFDLGRSQSIDGELRDTAPEVAENIIKEHGEICETCELAKSFLKEYDTIYNRHERIENLFTKYRVKRYSRLWEESIKVEDKLTDLNEDFKKNLLKEYWHILQKEYKYLTSEEAIIETIEANDYDFTEEGRIYS